MKGQLCGIPIRTTRNIAAEMTRNQCVTLFPIFENKVSFVMQRKCKKAPNYFGQTLRKQVKEKKKETLLQCGKTVQTFVSDLKRKAKR